MSGLFGDLAGAPVEAQGALAVLALAALAALGWGLWAERAHGLRARRFRAAARLSRALFAAAGLRRRGR